MDSPSQHEKSVSAGRNSKGGASEIDSYTCDYISHRLDSIEEKVRSTVFIQYCICFFLTNGS